MTRLRQYFSLALLFLAGTPALLWAETVETTQRLGGLPLRIRVTAADKATAQQAHNAARAALEHAWQQLDLRLTTSPLARLNAAAAPLQPDYVAPLHGLIEQVHACADRLEGAYDPTARPAVKLWSAAAAQEQTPRRIPLRRARARVDYQWLARWLQGKPAPVRLALEPAGMRTGYALQAAAAAVADYPVQAVRISLGAQQLFYPQTHAAAMTVMHPVFNDRPVTTITARGGSLAVAGDADRTVVLDNIVYSNILDPRRMHPAPMWGVLTLWAPDPVEADCLADGLYVLGPTAARAWVEAHPAYGAVLAIAGPQGVTVQAVGRLRGKP